MSANNVLILDKVNGKYVLTEHDMDSGALLATIQCKSLDQALRTAKKYISENGVEYNLYLGNLWHK